ncbi:hypothetical protein EIB18_03010 [Caulobacter vibrioides]|uniref:hypothetical protein n=1 Tax=Caulobacter vibrioides TaxID=155892 RepID=UPI000BB50169|nr:hypothetical protein [Caulobacter vibrioides]ATC23560.1 hypothetical protein CA608_02940 [Caulobacter vibrioides]AZH11784.1 hypothetical protein EIB18_03010 [Caulobacter vibrioides]PLR11847.1 hypothetical protein CVUC_10640 [Caulobacter vibrioides]
MPVLSSFSLPAFIEDIPTDTPENKALNAELKWRWNVNVTGWIAQAMPGAPCYFYDPTTTDIPTGTGSAPVTWNAFPGRLQQFYSASPPNTPANPYKLPQDQIYSLADTGYYLTGDGGKATFQNIPAALCPEADWTGDLKTFGPYGPRGWLDEYCEWSAARDANGNLVRIDFACENPEYWTTLWKVSPETVAGLYQSILNWDAPAERQVSVALEDLQLSVGGKAVIDPETGRPAYNPLNKWNSGPVAVRIGEPSGFSGGALHLTSTPNTLQTELGLAGASTVQFSSGNSDQQALICCGQFGQEYRHSDPHIGQSVNAVVAGALTGGAPQLLCLADPVGLYIQPLNNPLLFTFGPAINPGNLPGGAQASDVFQIVRGAASVTDPVTGQPFPGAMILHVVCQIPSAWLAAYPDMTLADIQIGGAPITWAGQVATQFNIGLYARPLSAGSTPPTEQCASGLQSPSQPLQSLIFTSLWDAYYNQVEIAPTGQTMSLASNTTFIAPCLVADGQAKALTLTVVNPSQPSPLPKVAVLLADGSGPDPDITVSVEGTSQADYAVPGNSYPGSYTALALQVTISPKAAAGLRGVMVTDPSGVSSSLPAALYILDAE